jgi:hypothetical protein
MNTSAEPVNSTTALPVDAPLNKRRLLYWVAINGGSASVTPFPLPLTVKCFPTPQLLIGFETSQEARSFQTLALTAPIRVVRKEIDLMRQNPKVVCIAPPKPQPPTRGSTNWSSN